MNVWRHLDAEDEPIPGLYAGGSTTGCWESDSYCYEMTGHLLGFAFNSGRIAGENAAAYVSTQDRVWAFVRYRAIANR